MKTVLCYGDSLTWGYDAETQGRHRHRDRWPSVVQAALGHGVEVIAEGLSGRTTGFDDPLVAADRNGVRILPTILSSHAPIDLVVLMLGTNDMKPFHGRIALEASYGMRRLVQIIKGHFQGQPPKIILVAPPKIVPTNVHPEMMVHFGNEAAIEASLSFAEMYQWRAREEGVGFFDASTVATTSPDDGIHLDAANTRAIGVGLAPLVKEMLGL